MSAFLAVAACFISLLSSPLLARPLGPPLGHDRSNFMTKTDQLSLENSSISPEHTNIDRGKSIGCSLLCRNILFRNPPPVPENPTGIHDDSQPMGGKFNNVDGVRQQKGSRGRRHALSRGHHNHHGAKLMRVGCVLGTCQVQNLSHRLFQFAGQSGHEDSAPVNPRSPHSYG